MDKNNLWNDGMEWGLIKGKSLERARILEIIDKCVVKWDKAKIVYVEELKKEIENGD